MGVQVLELSPDPQQSKKIFRAPTGDIVCLDRSPELRGILIDIKCVNPVGEQIQLECEKEKAMFTLKSAGPYKVTWKMCVKPSDKNQNSVYTVTVLADPVITNSTNTTDLTTVPSLKVDQIAAQSHLTKCCGDIENWEDVFRVSLESGYNTVHLTPVQELGVSRSSYSLHSHLKLASSLKLNSSGGYEEDLKIFSDHLQDLHQKTGMFFLTDVVWNHVSVCNRDILEHPESYYNLHNTPNLIPAYLIDRSIREFSFTLSDSSEITNLHSFSTRLSNHLVETSHKLEQIYKIDVDKMLDSKESATDSLDESLLKRSHIDEVVKHSWQVEYSQSEYGGRVDMGILRTFLSNREITSIPEQNSQIVTAISLFNEFVAPAAVQDVISKVVSAVVGDVKYRFIDENGPKHQFGDVPLVERYFQISDISFDEEKELDIYDRLDAERIKTCNGWTTGESISDMSKTMAYTKREVIIWGDSIKLRFGNSREDAPWLWNYMEKYTCDMAKLFHGFRIDNCHNTSLHVGEELLRAARRVRPNLYIVAELFTGCEDKDCEIINRMGISSCVRELNKAGSPQQLANLIHHYGESKPCGSFISNLPSDQAVNSLPTLRMAPSYPHAMLMDQTHDNPCPFDQHPLPNVLALSGLMCAAKCSIGSNRGYDELIPHHIHVVQEERQYPGGRQSYEDALKPAKRALIKLHQWLEDNGYSETFVDQATEDVVIVTRHHPVTCSKVLVVIATCWSDTFTKTSKHTVNLPGDKADVLLETEIRDGGSFNPHKDLITGLCGVEVNVRENPDSSNMVTVSKSEEKLELSFLLSPGCVVATLVHPGKSAQHALNYFNSYILNKHTFATELKSVCSSLDLYELNYILYRCDEEERLDGCGGVYDIPGHGKLTYAGLVGAELVNDDFIEPKAEESLGISSFETGDIEVIAG